MSLVSWIEEHLLRKPQYEHPEDWQQLGADLRKLKAEAGQMRARGREIRREIAAALAAQGHVCRTRLQ